MTRSRGIEPEHYVEAPTPPPAAPNVTVVNTATLSQHDRGLLAQVNAQFAAGGYISVTPTREQYKQLLDDILELEPHLKHYRTDGKWDHDRIHRAAEHLRGVAALESVGYTDHPIEHDCD